MLKGTNRRIIEVNKTNSDYFEKAILFVKSDKVGFPTHTLNNEADEFLSEIDKTHSKKFSKTTIIFIILFLSMIAIIIFSLLLL